MFRVVVLTSVLFLVLCFSAWGDDELKPMKWGKVTDAEWEMGAPDDYPSAGVVVLRGDGEYVITTGNVTMSRHMRLKILTEAGLDEAGEFQISYHGKADKLRGFKAQTITPDGKRHKVKGNAIFKKSSGDYDYQTFTFPALEPGCIIEYQYTLSSNRHIYVPIWYFQSRFYTYQSNVHIDLFPGFDYAFRDHNIPAHLLQPKVTERPDVSLSHIPGAKVKQFWWTLENLPPITDEPYMCAAKDYMSALEFQLISYTGLYSRQSFASTWEEIGEDREDWITRYCSGERKIRKLADSLTQGLTTDAEKSLALFKYVQQEIATSYDYKYRYLGHETLDDLLVERKGTGEEKNILLAKLHVALDIPSWPVMISTRDNGQFDPQSPTARQFNYIVTFAKFGDRWEFLDAANENAPYGLLDPNCLSEGGLLIDGKNSQLVRMTIQDLNSMRIDHTTVDIDDEGVASCEVVSVYTGYYASEYAGLAERLEPDEFVRRCYTNGVNLTCDLEDISIARDSLDRLIVTFAYVSEDWTESFDGNLIVKPLRYSFRANPFKTDRRFTPVDFAYPFTNMAITEIHSSFDPVLAELPPDTTFESAGVYYERSSVATEDGITVKSTFQVSNPIIRQGSYMSLKFFFDKLAAASVEEVVLVASEGE